MRRCADDVLASAVYHQQMPILYARNEVHTVIAQFAVEVLDEPVALFGGEMAAVMEAYLAIAERDDVTDLMKRLNGS